MINENTLKIVGSASIPEELEIDTDYTVTLVANVQSKDTRSNNDGTFQLAHKLKLTGEVELKTVGKVIYGKSKGSPSQRFRSRLRGIHQGDDFDKFYDLFYSWLIEKADELYDDFKS